MSLPEFDATALELVLEFGGDGLYETSSRSAYNPSTGSVAVTTVQTPIKVVLVDLTLATSGLYMKSGTDILAGDKEAYVIPPNKTGGAALAAITPNQDRVIVGSVSYQVIAFKEVNPSGTDPILYTLYLRR